MPIRVLVVEDQPMMREALGTYVCAAPDMECVAAAADGLQAVQLATEHRPDAIIMDIGLPKKNGVQATAEITRADSEVGVLAVTTFATANHIVSMLRAGARGYVLKDASAAEVMTAVREVAEGGIVLSPPITRELIDDVASDTDEIAQALADQAALPEVPDSQLAVLRLIGRGMSNAEIAAELYFELDTVKKYVSRLNRRFGTRDRVQLLVRATQLGFIKPHLKRPVDP